MLVQAILAIVIVAKNQYAYVDQKYVPATKSLEAVLVMSISCFSQATWYSSKFQTLPFDSRKSDAFAISNSWSSHAPLTPKMRWNVCLTLCADCNSASARTTRLSIRMLEDPHWQTRQNYALIVPRRKRRYKIWYCGDNRRHLHLIAQKMCLSHYLWEAPQLCINTNEWASWRRPWPSNFCWSRMAPKKSPCSCFVICMYRHPLEPCEGFTIVPVVFLFN